MKSFIYLASVLLMLAAVGVLEAALPPADNNFGGYHDKNVMDNDVQEMAAFAAQEMGHELMEIKAAQMAVVAGFNYRMELVLRQVHGQDLMTCTAIVFLGLMDTGKQLTNYSCVL